MSQVNITLSLTTETQNYLSSLKSKKVVIGFSGGPDSVTTYQLVLDYYKKKGRNTNAIYLAHYNHNFRAESAQEADYISSTYDNVIVGQYLGKCYKEKDLRNARHQFFKETMNQIGTTTLIVGHNLNDRIETTLMNNKRGAGLNGRINMRTIDSKGSYTILRPLLDMTKKDILDYCNKQDHHYFTDPSNEDDSVSQRNKVRKSIGHFNSKDFDTYRKYYQEREKEFDSHQIAYQQLNLPSYFGFDKVFKVDKELNTNQLIKLLKEIHEYNDIKSVYLKDLIDFIHSKSAGYKKVGERTLQICHKQPFLHKENAHFDPGQVLSYWLQGNTNIIRLVDLKQDTYNGKPVNKRFINNKIPVFLRHLVPVDTQGKYCDNLIMSLLQNSAKYA